MTGAVSTTNRVGCARTCSYRCGSMSIRSVQCGLPHSQTIENGSAWSPGSAAPSATICSLTAPNSASLAASRSSRSDIRARPLVELSDDLGRRPEFLHNDVAVVSLDDPAVRPGRGLGADRVQETRRGGTDCFVLLQAQQDQLRARFVGALADERHDLNAEFVGGRFDLLVRGPEGRVVAGHTLCALPAAAPSRGSPTETG